MRKLLLAAVCLAGGALAQTAPAPIGNWRFTTNYSPYTGRVHCQAQTVANIDGWTLSVPREATHLHLRHPSMRVPMRYTGEVAFLGAGRERTPLQFLGSEILAGSFIASSPQRMEQILSTNRKITVDIPGFGPQDFDVSGFAQARQVYLGCN
jgi:hypothetical protein